MDIQIDRWKSSKIPLRYKKYTCEVDIIFSLWVNFFFFIFTSSNPRSSYNLFYSTIFFPDFNQKCYVRIVFWKQTYLYEFQSWNFNLACIASKKLSIWIFMTMNVHIFDILKFIVVISRLLKSRLKSIPIIKSNEIKYFQ